MGRATGAARNMGAAAASIRGAVSGGQPGAVCLETEGRLSANRVGFTRPAPSLSMTLGPDGRLGSAHPATDQIPSLIPAFHVAPPGGTQR